MSPDFIRSENTKGYHEGYTYTCAANFYHRGALLFYFLREAPRLLLLGCSQEACLLVSVSGVACEEGWTDTADGEEKAEHRSERERERGAERLSGENRTGSHKSSFE